MALVAEKRLGEALPHFQKAVEFAPADTDARSNLGNALRTLGRAAEAVVEYETALEQAPGDPTIHYNLATALLDLGRTGEAALQLKEAVSLDPDYGKAQLLLQRMEAQTGR
jgi:Flp pilus assembly protein TadD